MNVGCTILANLFAMRYAVEGALEAHVLCQALFVEEVHDGDDSAR